MKKLSLWKAMRMSLQVTLVAPAFGGALAMAQQAAPVQLGFETALVSEEVTSPVSTTAPCLEGTPGCAPAAPGYQPAVPGQVPQATVPQAAPTTPDAIFSNPAPTAAPQNFGSLPAGQGALTGQNLIAAANMPGGYLDPAAPVTMFRLRYDVANDNAYGDRGEYFYAKCGCFRQANLDPNAAGPGGLNTSVDSQTLSAYMEYATSERFSIFADLPVRFVDFSSLPDPGGTMPSPGSDGGLGDMNAGFKYALIADPDEYLTFQLRTYIPTGESTKGLGTDHVSIEPSLLYYRRLSQRWMFQSQFTGWTPIGGSDFASDVLQYGAGVGYLALQTNSVTVMPTFEAVGWTFLGGQKFNPLYGQSSANGDTIFNIKPGVRIGLGDPNGPMMMPSHSIYAGFGIPVTNEKFYNDLFRIEYRIVF